MTRRSSIGGLGLLLGAGLAAGIGFGYKMRGMDYQKPQDEQARLVSATSSERGIREKAYQEGYEAGYLKGGYESDPFARPGIEFHRNKEDVLDYVASCYSIEPRSEQEYIDNTSAKRDAAVVIDLRATHGISDTNEIDASVVRSMIKNGTTTGTLWLTKRAAEEMENNSGFRNYLNATVSSKIPRRVAETEEQDKYIRDGNFDKLLPLRPPIQTYFAPRIYDSNFGIIPDYK